MLQRDRRLVFALAAGSTIAVGIGTDLMLPAVPSLPGALGGSAAQAQLVLASYVLGTSAGLLTFGELGTRVSRYKLLLSSLVLFAAASLAAALSSDIGMLILARFVQGAFGAAPAVFAPGFIRAAYGDAAATGALGRLGSIEALTPALAPIAGVGLLRLGGWQTSFMVTAGLALAMAVILLLQSKRMPSALDRPTRGGYARLLTDRVFMRYAISQALSLASLFVFVFGAPAVFVGPLHLGISAFIVLQISGITLFILAANLSPNLSARFGPERLIGGGTASLAVGFGLILFYGLNGGRNQFVITALWLIVNTSIGLRGPSGFHLAMVSSDGDDSRGSALVILGTLAAAAAGTALAAPFITRGLAPLAGIAFVMALVAVLSLMFLPLPQAAVD